MNEKITRLKEKYGMFAPEQSPWRTVRDALHGIPDPRTAHGIADHIFRDGARTFPATPAAT